MITRTAGQNDLNSHLPTFFGILKESHLKFMYFIQSELVGLPPLPLHPPTFVIFLAYCHVYIATYEYF